MRQETLYIEHLGAFPVHVSESLPKKTRTAVLRRKFKPGERKGREKGLVKVYEIEVPAPSDIHMIGETPLMNSITFDALSVAMHTSSRAFGKLVESIAKIRDPNSEIHHADR